MSALYSDLLLSGPLYLSKREFRAAFLRHRSEFGGRILDVGCGDKPFEQFLSGLEHVGVDHTPTSRADVRAVAGELPFPEGTFDTILCTEVLEHVPEPSLILAECYRVVKPGGVLYVTVPMTWYLHYEPHDFFRYTKYGIRFLCEKTGFDVVSLERMGGFTMYVCLRASEFLNTILTSYVLAPLRILGIRARARSQLATIALIPFQLVALMLVLLFDRFSPRDARGWTVVTRCRKSLEY